MNRVLTIGIGVFWLICSASSLAVSAQENTPPDTPIRNFCPVPGVQPRAAQFEPGGIILTSFDRTAIWVYNIDRNSRYPLPDTAPCGANCHLSRDARWITYLVDVPARIFGKMRLDGTERTPLARDATEIQWWDEETLLVWTLNHTAYFQPDEGAGREEINVRGVTSIQPGGHWALLLEQDGDDFLRVLVNLQTRDLAWMQDDRTVLDVDTRYFNAATWSPDGNWLAYTTPITFDPTVNTQGAEIYLINPDEREPRPLTNLFATYGAVRINGHAPGSLSWSPDGTRIAFWVAELIGPNPETNAGQAVIHIVDVETGAITAYCGFATGEHTPNPPRLVWSPDGTHLAFGGKVDGDTRGYLLMALDVEGGTLTELSVGIYPALGSPDVIAWGLPPR